MKKTKSAHTVGMLIECLGDEGASPRKLIEWSPVRTTGKGKP
jgi:hypothetical protein